MQPLWPHQANGVAAARRAYAAGARGILLRGATGSGKTRCGLEIAMGAIAKGQTVDWLAHRDELVQQPLAKLRDAGAPAGLLGDNQPITILSPQTALARGLKSTASVVVFDEARHYATAPQWSTLAEAVVDRGALRIGLDATPSGDLRSIFDVMVHVADIQEMIDGGFLVPPGVFAPNAYQDALASTPLAAYLERVPGQSTIVFCASVAHAEETAAEFRAAGIAAECVEGSMARGDRRETLERFTRRETLVLTNVLCLCEGTDLPLCSAIILARGCSSEEMWIQIGGRALRRFTGKSKATILDLRGHVHNYGLLEESRAWSLDGTPVRRVEALPACTQCPGCLSWGAPSSRCPDCGFTRPPPPKPKVTPAQLQEQTRRRQDRAAATSTPDFVLFCELVNLARDRGYKPGWARVEFKRQTRRWAPFRLDQVPARDGDAEEARSA